MSPNLPFQLEWLDLIMVVSIVFIVLAVIIAVVLLLLIRRATRSKHSQSQPAVQAEAITQPSISVETEETVLSPTKAISDKDDTSPHLPAVKTLPDVITLPISGQRPAGIGWQIAGLTDVGLKRELNEDSLRLIEAELPDIGPYGLYIIADGLGGHAAGEIASQLTIEAIQQQHTQHPPASGLTSFEEWLKELTLAANEAVLKHQKDNTDSRKMGSTLVMALVVGQNAYIINVGDSRAYYLSGEQIEQVSIDHSLVERLVQIGQITREEARTHKQKNVIYSTIGEKEKMEIGFYQINLNSGDRLLLCSDGLSNMVTDEDLLKISRQQADLAQTVHQMVEMAKQAGGHDNITAIMIQMNGQQ